VLENITRNILFIFRKILKTPLLSFDIKMEKNLHQYWLSLKHIGNLFVCGKQSLRTLYLAISIQYCTIFQFLSFHILTILLCHMQVPTYITSTI